MACRSATISLVSRHYGAGEHGAIATDVKVSAVFAVAATVPLVALFWFAAEPLIGLLGSDPTAIRYGADYLQVAALAMPFAALNLIGSRALIGGGDAWTPMIVRAGSAVANIGLNAVLIFGLDLGVVGAAVGTVIGNVAGLAAFAAALVTGRFPGVGELPVRIPIAGPVWDADTACTLAEISVPLALRRAAQNGGQFPLLAIVGLLGANVVAAFVIGMVLTPPDVISQTLLALPMWVLFEIGVMLARAMRRRQLERTGLEAGGDGHD